MIRRVVRLSIDMEKVDEFIRNFENNKVAIRNFKGCEHLELWRDTDHDNVFVTYSHWQSKEDLDAYRHSELFLSIWAKTKVLFCERPLAWSHLQIA